MPPCVLAGASLAGAMDAPSAHTDGCSGPFQLRRSFRLFDRSASGQIDLDDFLATLKDYFSMNVTGGPCSLHALTCVSSDHHLLCTEDECTAVFAAYDKNLNGALEYKEFCTLIVEPDFKEVKQW